MRTIIVLAAAVLISSGPGRAQTRMGIDIRNGELHNFYFAVGDYYRVPVREIQLVGERGIPEDEIPVVYFIARDSRYEPSAIIRMRLEGSSWMDISSRCGVSPGAYYDEGSGYSSGPPYGNAWGYYKNHGRKNWRRAYHSDNDIITSVNVHWMRDRYGCTVPEVIRLRSDGESFGSINERFYSRHEGDHEGQGHGRGGGNHEGQGHGRGHGKHKGWNGDD